jgi:hypothetical protein
MFVNRIQGGFIARRFGHNGHTGVAFKDASQPNARDYISVGNHDAGLRHW